MEFRIKYDIGEEVWFLSQNKICKGVVDHVCLKITKFGIEICHYHIKRDDVEVEKYKKTVRTEDYLFKTKQELWNSLTLN